MRRWLRQRQSHQGCQREAQEEAAIDAALGLTQKEPAGEQDQEDLEPLPAEFENTLHDDAPSD
ncbi:MAG: hypothetical protein SGPRY_005391 [Prymnesium sp.]